ncbi:ion channel protein Tsx, partial [Acinetobacter baumannii]
MQLKQLAATCALLSATAMVQAKLMWQAFSVVGLYGENYEFVDDKDTTIPLEYAAKVNYADVFFFMD